MDNDTDLSLDALLMFLQKETLPRENVKRRCAVCGKPLSKFLFRRRLQKNTLYCSWQCFVFKSPAVIQLERQFGMDIKQILIETTRKYDTLEKQEQALGKSSQWIYSSIRKYFGTSLQDFMYVFALGARKRKYQKKVERLRSVSNEKPDESFSDE